jgi:2-polyprenyl-6-methoxyphenol hydroxylase-like FAD-dependent oxidoreductase
MNNDSRPFSDSPFRIAIVGGGPGGLTLARILHTRGIATTVYELDDHPLVRPQGGTLDLHADGGQMALQRAGLAEGFLSIARYEDQGARLLDRDARVLFEEPEGLPSERDRPEVDRTLLRTLLIGSLPPGIIQWGRRLRTVEPLEDGRYRLDFTDGSHEDYDFIVGSDGAWSKVRPLVSNAVPEYSGVTFVETGFDHADTDHPQIARLVGRGKMFALGESKGILSQRNGNSHIRAYFAFRVAENWIRECGIDFASTEKTRARLLARFDGWAPGLRAFVEDSDNWFVPRALYALPSGHSWPSRPGVTLLGDAAHLMSPFGGFGANYAMLDAAELAEAIEHGLKSGDRTTFDTAIASYESRMCERSAPAAAAALEGLHGAFSEDAFAHVFDHLGNGEVPQEA